MKTLRRARRIADRWQWVIYGFMFVAAAIIAVCMPAIISPP